MVKKKEDDIPEWVTDEIQNAKFKKPVEMNNQDIFLSSIMMITKLMHNCMMV